MPTDDALRREAPSGCGPGEERCSIINGGRSFPEYTRIVYCPRHAAAPLLVEALKAMHGDGCDWCVKSEAALRAAGETA